MHCRIENTHFIKITKVNSLCLCINKVIIYMTTDHQGALRNRNRALHKFRIIKLLIDLITIRH